MRIKLDAQLIADIWHETVKYPLLTKRMEGKLRFHTEKKWDGMRESGADNYVSALIEQLREIVSRICRIQVINDDLECCFPLYEFLNDGRMLINCVTELGRCYGAVYEESGEPSCFRFAAECGIDSDEQYYNCLQSLCLSRSLEVQGKEPVLCPFITRGDTAVLSMEHPQWEDADGRRPEFLAFLYYENKEFARYLPIYTQELFDYVARRYDFLKNVLEAVKDYYARTIQELREKHIPLPEECPDYMTYLRNLESALQERCFTACYAREWMAIMKTSYQDPVMQDLLLQFQNAVKAEIVKVHERLQKMDCMESEPVKEKILRHSIGSGLEEYEDQLERIARMHPPLSAEDEDFDPLEMVDEQPSFQRSRAAAILSLAESVLSTEIPLEKLTVTEWKLECRYHMNTSEQARLALKFMESVYQDVMKFDYMQNDWHLLLQFEIANWLLERKKG